MNSSATLFHKTKRAPYFRQPNVFSNHSRQPSARLTPPPSSPSPSLLDSTENCTTTDIKRLSPRGITAAGFVSASPRTHATFKTSTTPPIAAPSASLSPLYDDVVDDVDDSTEHSKVAEELESASSIEDEIPASAVPSLPASSNVSPDNRSRPLACGPSPSRPSTTEIELMPDSNSGHLHPHHSSRFHADALSTWNAYGYAAAHLCFLGSAAYLILDQVTDFSENLDSQTTIYVQAGQNLFLTLLFVIDAILYYKGSMYAPWRLEPGTIFHVLPQEFYQSRFGRFLCCGRGNNVSKVQSRVVEVKPKTSNNPIQQIQPTRLAPETEPEVMSRTVSSTLASATPSTNSPQKISPTISHTNTFVRKEDDNSLDKTSMEPSASPPAVNPSSLHQALAALPPIHSPDELGYFFPLSCCGLGEAFNILASLVWFTSALYALYPVLNPSRMQDADAEHSFIRVQHSLDILCMVFWTLSSVFYHRDWQLNYTHGDYWYMQLDGSASVANIVASLLYLYACGLAAYLGKQVPHSWRLIGTTPIDATTNSSDPPSWMSHLWAEMYWCALLADILYVLSALLYEISDYRHSRRVKQVLKERARLYELQLTLIANMRHSKQQLYNNKQQKETEAASIPTVIQ